MITHQRISTINDIVSNALNEAWNPDFTFSSTRRNLTMPDAYSAPAIPSQADILAGQRMRASYGGSIPSGYSEEERQAAIKKQRAVGDKTTIGGRKGDEEAEGESWIDKAQRVADIATFAGGFVPGLNVASSAIQALSAGIDVAQGQKGEATLRGVQAGAGLIPGGRLITKAGTKGAAAVAAGMPGARAVTGLRGMLPAISPASWKPALIAAGGRPISTGALKAGLGLAARTPAQMSAGGGMAGGAAEGTEAAEAPAAALPKPKHKQVEFEGQMWDENLAKQLQQHRAKQAATAVPSLKTTIRTPPRKPSGEVDIEAWHTMTGMKIPKTYEQTKRAIEVTKPYGYNPLEVDPSLRSRYEKVKKQVEQSV